MFIDHFVLKYMLNKLVLGENIYQWLLLFQEFDFEIIMNPGLLNSKTDHLSWIETSEEPTNIVDGLLDAQLFRVGMVDDYYE